MSEGFMAFGLIQKRMKEKQTKKWYWKKNGYKAIKL